MAQMFIQSVDPLNEQVNVVFSSRCKPFSQPATEKCFRLDVDSTFELTLAGPPIANDDPLGIASLKSLETSIDIIRPADFVVATALHDVEISAGLSRSEFG